MQSEQTALNALGVGLDVVVQRAVGADVVELFGVLKSGFFWIKAYLIDNNKKVPQTLR